MDRQQRSALKRGLLVSAMIAAASFLADVGAASAATPEPTGVWIWDDGRAAVEFHPCGEALCGRIVWLKSEAVPQARPVLDIKNPDTAQRGRRVCGIDYITGLKPTKAGAWKAGRIYDFNGGATYDLDIDSADGSTVKMRGYNGVRLLGVNLTLVRPSSELKFCKLSG